MVIFLSIAIASFLIVAGSFIFHLDHDVDHDAGAGSDAGGDHTISLFSFKVLGTLCMGFGAAGAIAQLYGFTYAASSGVGLLCGVGLAAIMYLMLWGIARQQSSSLVSTSTLVGATGTVAVTIGQDALGEVGVSFGGQYGTYSARSRDGREIAKGRTVRVLQAVGSQLTVEEIM